MNQIENKSQFVVDDQEVCILGLGYVGLTLATVLSDVGYKVIGVDRDESLIEGLKKGVPHFHEKGLEEMMKTNARSQEPTSYHVSLTEPCASVYIVTVGTPILRPSLQPNLDYVRSAVSEVANVLRSGDMVILRSTVPVGTTRKIVQPLLEEVSGLQAGVDFDLAFCPERTVEGKALRELRELPQIIGGFNDKGATRAASLFRRSTSTIIDVGSVESAEMLKILDNTYRDMMFAYANQMALLCEELNLDMVPIVRAANQGYNRNRIPVPSPGVGGACLSKDPYILADVCRSVDIDPALFLKGREINEYMPIRVCECVSEELTKLGKSIRGAEVFVLGFAFKGKPETSDMRDSPTLDLVKELKRLGAHIRGHDPLVPENEIKELGVKFCSLEQGFEGAEVVIIMLDHPMYEEMDAVSLSEAASNPLIIMDGWHIFDSTDMDQNSNIIYRCVGR